jgi:hypothetical protein
VEALKEGGPTPQKMHLKRLLWLLFEERGVDRRVESQVNMVDRRFKLCLYGTKGFQPWFC